MSDRIIALGKEHRFSEIQITDHGEKANIEFFYRDLILPEKLRPRLRLWRMFIADNQKIVSLLRQEDIQDAGCQYGPKMPDFSYKEVPVVETGTGAVAMSDEIRKAYPDVQVKMTEIVYDDQDAYDEAEKTAPLRIGIDLTKENLRKLERKIEEKTSGSWPAYFANVLERLSQPMKAGYTIQ